MRHPRFVHAPVLAGGGWSASIITFESERPLTDDDVVALEIAATVTALAITKAHAVGAVESKFQSEFLHDLLNDRVKSAAEAHARAAQFGWKFDHPLTVVIAEFRDPQPEGPDEWAARLSRVSRNMTSVLHARGDRDCAVVTLSREVVTIGAMSPDEPLEKRRQAMLKELSTLEPGVRIGVSRIVDGAMGIAAGYWQARKALDVGQRIVGQNAVVHFDDLGAFRILSLLNSGQEIQGFVSEVLGELANDDERSEEMLKTLQSLFEHNLNVAETARSMHYHYNTMRYRVERLQLALGPFTTDAELRFSLQLALRLLQIRND